MRRVGVYGGSFNPVHDGHVALARYLVERGGLDEVWLTVSPRNPFKDEAELAPDEDRLAMVRLAASGVPGLKVCDEEMRLPRPSYTICTLRRLAVLYPGVRFIPVIGADNLPGLGRWKESEALLRDFGVWVYPRQGIDAAPWLARYPEARYLADCPLFGGRATDIRSALARGDSRVPFLDPRVFDYIRRKGLYAVAGRN